MLMFTLVKFNITCHNKASDLRTEIKKNRCCSERYFFNRVNLSKCEGASNNKRYALMLIPLRI